MLLAAINHPDGLAARAITSLGVSTDSVLSRAQQTSARPGPLQGPFAKRFLELSLREALALGHDRIGSGHMLLGLIRGGSNPGTQTLEAEGLDLHRLRQQVLALLHG